MQKIGKYEVLEILGEGGMGIVYKAFDPLMEREVAIKVLSERVFGLPEIKERFYREARSAGQLSHENITIFHDLGETEGKPYIVMEYLPGTDLRAIIKNKTELSLKQKLHFAAQICRGLAYSHSRNIIHRDVKPENIRILDDGKVKIMDFGIAKPTTSTMTQTGTVMGTPFYMSPEQIKGRHVDHRSDIFSFGVLLFELITYKLPFPGDSPTTVSYKIVHEKPEPIDNNSIDNISEVREIILKCLAKEPENRYQGLAEIARDLENVSRQIEAAEGTRRAEEVRQFEKLVAESKRFLAKKNFSKALELAEKAANLTSKRTTEFELIQQIKEEEERERQRRESENRLKAASKWISSREFERALGELQALLDADPQNTEAAKLLEAAKKGLASKNQQEQISGFLTAARDYLQNEDFARAAQQVDEVLKLDSRHNEALKLKKAIADAQQTKEAAKQRAVAETVLIEPESQKTKLYAPPKPLKEKIIQKAKPERRLDTKKVGITAAAALIVITVFIYRMFFSTPAPSVGYVSLNILPWAEVTEVTNEQGEAVSGLGNAGEKMITPCRLSLPAGKYNIQLSNPQFSASLQIPVAVETGRTEVVTRKFPGFDYREILSRIQ
jgi:serine/threonine-protein kinase